MKIQPKNQHKNDADKRRSILEGALQVFAQKGFNDATISQIARKANVAEATIYEYFDSKEHLLFCIPAQKIEEALDLLQVQLAGIKGALNKIRKLIWFTFWFFQNNPEWTSVFFLLLRNNKSFIFSPECELLREWSERILKILKEGQEEGSVSQEIDLFIARNLLLGTIDHLTTRWVLKSKPDDLTSLADRVAELIISAIKKDDREQKIYFINSKINIVTKEEEILDAEKKDINMLGP